MSFCMSQRNTFQCVLVSDGVRSFTFFHYADGMIEWTTSGPDGITGVNNAEIGYDAGDGINYHNVYFSGTPEVINITSTSNVGVGGVWAFRLDQVENPSVACSEQSEFICIYTLQIFF